MSDRPALDARPRCVVCWEWDHVATKCPAAKVMLEAADYRARVGVYEDGYDAPVETTAPDATGCDQ